VRVYQRRAAPVASARPRSSYEGDRWRARTRGIGEVPAFTSSRWLVRRVVLVERWAVPRRLGQGDKLSRDQSIQRGCVQQRKRCTHPPIRQLRRCFPPPPSPRWSRPACPRARWRVGYSGVPEHDQVVAQSTLTLQTSNATATTQQQLNQNAIAFYRSIARSALQNGVSPSVSMSAVTGL
jgi:hypothetical protein